MNETGAEAPAFLLSQMADVTTLLSRYLNEMDAEFKLDLQQWNTMKVSGLAAYIQRPERDHVGWILAQGVWLPEWKPKKWAAQVQKLVVTFESLETVARLEEGQADYEPWEYLMLTDYESFLTDDQQTVEGYFAQYTDQPQFVQHPDQVNCPHEFNNHDLTDETPALWSLERRSVVDILLNLKAARRQIAWQHGNEMYTGLVGEVHPT